MRAQNSRLNLLRDYRVDTSEEDNGDSDDSDDEDDDEDANHNGDLK
jgi:hypothetical protein